MIDVLSPIKNIYLLLLLGQYGMPQSTYCNVPFMFQVRLNTIVTKIEQSGKKVTVTTKNGITYTADQALVTFSSGVLSNNLIEFVPRLPTWKMDTIHLMPMVHYCKVFFKFPMKFWDDNNYILLAQKTRGDRVHWQNLDKQPMYKGQNMLLLTLTEDLCLRADHMSDLDIIHEVMESLKKAYGASIPTPKGQCSIFSLDWFIRN